MKLAGFLLLLAGWCIVLAAIALLRTTAARAVFVLAGIATEVVGLIVVIRAQAVLPQERE